VDFSAVDGYMRALHDQKGVPGAQVWIYHHGLPVYHCLVGEEQEDTLHPLYSCTKPVTAVAAMQLVEQDTLRLDDPVETYLPEYGSAYILQDGRHVTVGGEMTVRHLLTMTAGLTYCVNTPAIRALQQACPEADTQQVVATFVQEPLSFRPGERFQYSLCHDALAAVVEVASGQRFSDYLADHVFAPLGMTESGFYLDEQRRRRLAPQYYVDEQGEVAKHAVDDIGHYRLTTRYESGGAGLFATAADYGRFAAAMSCGGTSPEGVRILRPETVDLMRQEHLSDYVMNNDFSCAAGEGYGYGLGVRTLVSKAAGQRSSLGEFGWDGAAGSYVLMDPTAEVAIVYTQQVLGWPQRFGCMHAPLRDLTYPALGL